MWLKGQKKYLCWLLVTVILLSGMCFENNKTDSSFSCAGDQIEKNITIMNILSCLSETSVKFCTNEMLGQGEIYATIEQIKLLGNRFFMRMQKIIFEINLQQIHCFSWSLKIIRDTEYQDSGGGRVTICYIQQQDGKKGELCY